MTDSVDIAHTAPGEGTACAEGAPLHVLPGLQVRTIFKSFQNIVMDLVTSLPAGHRGQQYHSVTVC